MITDHKPGQFVLQNQEQHPKLYPACLESKIFPTIGNRMMMTKLTDNPQEADASCGELDSDNFSAPNNYTNLSTTNHVS